MKYLFLILFTACAFVNCTAQLDVQQVKRTDSIDKVNEETIKQAGKYIQKITVSKSDSTMWLTANMKRDHRIFGYEKPDIHSRKQILISIFTNDVEGNPFHCPLGAYYQTSSIKDMQLKFISKKGLFVKVKVIRPGLPGEVIYILQKWTDFEK